MFAPASVMKTGSRPAAVGLAHGEDAPAAASADDQRALDDARNDDDAVGALEQPRRDGLFLDVDEGLEHLARIDQALVGLRVGLCAGGREVEQERSSQQGKRFPHVAGPWQTGGGRL